MQFVCFYINIQAIELIFAKDQLGEHKLLKDVPTIKVDFEIVTFCLICCVLATSFSFEIVVEYHENISETYSTYLKCYLDSRLRVDTRINGMQHLESEFINTFAI